MTLLIAASAAALAPGSGRFLLSALILVLLLGSVWFTRRRWRRRDSRQAELSMPHASFDLPGLLLAGPVPCQYLATTFAGDWLDRIVVHDLGVAGAAAVSRFEAGLLLEREGALDIAIPRSALVSVRLEKGIAGRVFEDDGVVMVGWMLGDLRIDSGLRAERVSSRLAIVAMLRSALESLPEEAA